MNRALLDTDIFSELSKGIDPIVLQNGAAYRASFGRYTLAVVTLMEVVHGLQKKQATRQLRMFLGRISAEEILDFDQSAAILAGRIEGDLERVGRPIGRADPMIAALALNHNLEVVTGNTAHYQYIQRLGYPLVLVDWRRSII
jgi:predicted nucleic acid-binding protein